MTRTEAREIAFKILYQLEINKEFDNPDLEKYFDQNMGSQEDYVKTAVHNVCQNLNEIDTIINENSKGWPLSRLAKVDLSIIRLAICEMLYVDDVPQRVAINEAVELAKKFSDDTSPKFINAVLGKIKF